MELVAWVMAAAGACLFVGSLVATLRANPSSTIPFYRSPPVIPAGSRPARLIGIILLLLSAALLAATIGYWSPGIVLAGPLLALTTIGLHNRRLSASSAEDRAPRN